MNGVDVSVLFSQDSDFKPPSLKTIPNGAVGVLVETFGIQLFSLWYSSFSLLLSRLPPLPPPLPPPPPSSLGRLHFPSLFLDFLFSSNHSCCLLGRRCCCGRRF